MNLTRISVFMQIRTKWQAQHRLLQMRLNSAF